MDSPTQDDRTTIGRHYSQKRKTLLQFYNPLEWRLFEKLPGAIFVTPTLAIKEQYLNGPQ